MSVRELARALVVGASRTALALGAEPRGLLTLVFHGIEAEGETAERLPLAPFQRITVETLITIISLLREADYAIVGPAAVRRGLPRQGRFAWITFDDGYANNLVLADLAQRTGASFTVFASTGHIETGEAFWWDALWRACVARGVPFGEFERRCLALKALTPPAIRAQITAEFGEGILTPCDDRDRPMTIAELTAFAAAEGITIGNHTRNHAILTVLPAAERRSEIGRAQHDLARWLGIAPSVLAYPNGNCDRDTTLAASDCGIELAVTTRSGRTRDVREGPLVLPRIALAQNHPRSIEDQIACARAGLGARRHP